MARGEKVSTYFIKGCLESVLLLPISLWECRKPPKIVLFWEPSTQSFHKYYFFVTSMVFSAEFLLISAAALSAVLVGDVIICSKK